MLSMKSDYQTVPNQKVVKVTKEVCNGNNYYAAINLAAIESAAKDLKSGAFKLWVYFAKNQNNYVFALSSKAVEETFGIKIKQYNNAIQELVEKGYLIQEQGNIYIFNEQPQTSSYVITKGDNDVMTKNNKELLPKDTRNNTLDNTNNNTKQFVF